MARKIAKKKRGGRPFSNGSGGPGPVITKARDNGFKIIFGDHNMFADFLRDFIKIDLFKGVQANDIEDITERFLPLFQEGRDSDTIKTVRLKGGSTYVMVVLEHESRVNYRQAFKMLQYITLFYDHYEKEENKKSTGASFRKDFKYPAVLPVVFYDGGGNWTAETNFYNKVENNVVFARYTPSFEYLVVNLADYDEKALTKFGDSLSIALIIAKMRWPDFKGLSEKLPEDYWNKVDLPPETLKALADYVAVFLTRINMPKDEIAAISDHIVKKEVNDMFSLLEKIDIQAERRRSADAIAEAENAKAVAAEAVAIAGKRLEKALREAEAERCAKEEAHRKEEEARRKGIALAMRLGASIETISQAYNISVEEAANFANNSRAYST